MAKQSDWKSLALKSAGLVAGAGVTGVTAWMLYSRFVLDHKRPLAKAINARRCEDDLAGFGLLSHYEDTSAAGAPPLVLLHSINAAASAYEMKPLFEMYRQARPVFAPDLPGFGFSARLDLPYSPELYARAIAHWIRRNAYRGEPVDVVALSLSGEFAALAALHHPELFRSLVLISPTGFDRGGPAAGARAPERVRKTISVPLWSQPFFDALVTMPSIRRYLKKAFNGPVDNGLAQYAYETSHQPGARFAPLYFIAGKLFTPRVIESVYARLEFPVLVMCDRNDYSGFELLPGFLDARVNWRAVRIPGTGGMPHFEKPKETATELDAFWSTFRTPAPAPPVSSTLPG